MKRQLCFMFMFVLAAFSAAPAKADFIQEWDYQADGIFVSWTDQAGRYSDAYGNNTPNVEGRNLSSLSYDSLNGEKQSGSMDGYKSVRWGNAFSGWTVIGINSTSSTVVTGDTLGSPGVTLWHNNKAISASASTLQSGQVLLTLTLDSPLVPAESKLGTFGITMDFSFIETPNDSWYIDDGKWTKYPDEDIFIIKDPFVSSVETFVYDGYLYTFSFEASFAPLTGWYLETAQAMLGTTEVLYGWTTAEGATSFLPTNLRITAEALPPAPTPEPGTMVLLGAGLIGLGAMIRRRRG